MSVKPMHPESVDGKEALSDSAFSSNGKGGKKHMGKGGPMAGIMKKAKMAHKAKMGMEDEAGEDPAEEATETESEEKAENAKNLMKSVGKHVKKASKEAKK